MQNVWLCFTIQTEFTKLLIKVVKNCEEDDKLEEVCDGAEMDDEEATKDVKEPSKSLNLDMSPEEMQQKLSEETTKMVASAKIFGSN